MTLNLEGCSSCRITRTERISKGTGDHKCVICHQPCVQKKIKVLCELQYPPDDWRLGGVKRFFFCSPCFQGLRVYTYNDMKQLALKVGGQNTK